MKKRSDNSETTDRIHRNTQIVGMDITCGALSGDDVRRYHDILKNLPKNAGKQRVTHTANDPASIKAFWSDIAANNKGETLAIGGVEKHFSIVRSFIKRLYQLGLVERDLTPYLLIGKKTLAKGEQKRSEYDTEALKLIFNSYIYSDTMRPKEKPKSFHFWAPLIALTTGMRVAEIAALEVQDIVEVNGVRCFDLCAKWKTKAIADQGFDKSKKNASSIRVIPIPSTVLNAGFDELIGKRKTGLLFDDLVLSATKGLGNYISRWFNEYFRVYADIPKQTEDGLDLVFHCFRHSFVTRLDKTIIDGQPIKDSVGKYITGHADNSVRTTVYSHGQDMDYMKRYIDAIDFSDVLNGVKYSAFLSRKKSN